MVYGTRERACHGRRRHGWLERPERDEAEMPQQVIEHMQLKPTDVVADVGAGTGYCALRLRARRPAPAPERRGSRTPGRGAAGVAYPPLTPTAQCGRRRRRAIPMQLPRRPCYVKADPQY